MQAEDADKYDRKDDSYISNEADIPQSESQDRVIEFEEDKKIRDFIESGNIEQEQNVPDRDFDQLHDSRTEKKIFDEFEEEKIYKDKRKNDIGNPDIIDEFFGDNEERKY